MFEFNGDIYRLDRVERKMILRAERESDEGILDIQ